jgi:hypothetical protein
MNAQHTILGDISIPVGKYQSQGNSRKSYRKIGTLHQSTDDEGTRYWLKLNADAMNPVLFTLHKDVTGVPSDGSISADVYPPKA